MGREGVSIVVRFLCLFGENKGKITAHSAVRWQLTLSLMLVMCTVSYVQPAWRLTFGLWPWSVTVVDVNIITHTPPSNLSIIIIVSISWPEMQHESPYTHICTCIKLPATGPGVVGTLVC